MVVLNLSAMVPNVSFGRTLYVVGGTGVFGCVGIGVAVGVDVGGGGVGVSVGGSVGVTVKVAVGVEVGGTGGVAARDRNCNPPTTNNASTITPATRAKIRRRRFSRDRLRRNDWLRRDERAGGRQFRAADQARLGARRDA